MPVSAVEGAAGTLVVGGGLFGRRDGIAHGRVNRFIPRELWPAPMSQKAIGLIAGLPGVSTVVVGMRHPVSVDENFAIFDWPLFVPAQDLWYAL